MSKDISKKLEKLYEDDIEEEEIVAYSFKCHKCGKKIPAKQSLKHLRSLIEMHHKTKHYGEDD